VHAGVDKAAKWQEQHYSLMVKHGWMHELNVGCEVDAEVNLGTVDCKEVARPYW
jgi:hypothetical protein